MLAWPLAAVVVLAVKMLYVEDVLGDEIPTPDDDCRTEVREAKREAREVSAMRRSEMRSTNRARISTNYTRKQHSLLLSSFVLIREHSCRFGANSLPKKRSQPEQVASFV